MLDITFIRENPDRVKEAATQKGISVDVDGFLVADKKLRELQQQIDTLRAEKNKLTKNDIERGKELKAQLKNLEEQFSQTEIERHTLYRRIPNIPLADVMIGKNDSENTVARQVGTIPTFDFTPKEHFELGEALDIIDLERAAKISGARFYFLKREGAILETALTSFVFATLAKKGFIPMIPPVMIKPEMSEEMGYIETHPDEEAYYLERDNLYLTATSEQSLGALHAQEIIDVTEPLRYTALSTCFRRESGSYGKDTKGIFRVHQFNKIEMFVYCKPEDAEREHQHLLAIEEELMQALELPYQVMNICTGDLGKPAAKKYDIECWMPGQNRYRETHSTSNCTDYQARGLNIRYRTADNSLRFVYTLNGTAFALGRIIVAILENGQQKDGSIVIPKALHPYTGFTTIKR